MIGLDTNILVRFFTHDDPHQTPLARALVNSLIPENPGFVSLLVVAELVWVLESCYGFSKPEIISSLDSLLRSKEIQIQTPELAWEALRKFTNCRADYVDCLIERCAHAAGCSHTMTFDQKAASTEGMRVLR